MRLESTAPTPDALTTADCTQNWSQIEDYLETMLPAVDPDRLQRYRLQRLQNEMQAQRVDLCIFVNPVSLRYAADFRNYSLFMAHIPSTYLVLTADGEHTLHSAFAPDNPRSRPGVPISFMYGGDNLTEFANALARETRNRLREVGASGRRVALEFVNPSIVQAFERIDLEVVDGVRIVERARLIKSTDEINCLRRAIAVAELGARKVEECLTPGVSENQLWGLLNYTNQANDGGWHDGRMLASGPRINPWLQEATNRRIEAGDLVGFDTDMIGPGGYCADLSRTLFCGPGKPTQRQKQLYRYAFDELHHNLNLVRAGATFDYLQQNAWPVPEAFQANAYPCILHGVGMCDEFPHLHPAFRGELPYAGRLEAGMVVCLESYIGAIGERDGVKLEQQVLVTETGYEPLTQYPFCTALLD